MQPSKCAEDARAADGCEFPSCALISREIRTKYGIQVSASTVRKDLQLKGANARRRPKGPRRYVGDEEARLALAKKHRKDDFEKLLFSDEKYADCNDHGFGWEWCFNGAAPTPKGRERFGPRVHMWGLIGVGVKKLVILPAERINAELYQKHCIKPSLHIIKANQRVFMQDGAKPHVCDSTMRHLSKSGVRLLAGWPPRSPDLNPIEQVWAHIARKISDCGPTDEEELAEFVRQCWDAIPQATIDWFVRSFTAKLEACIALGGKTIPRDRTRRAPF